MTNVYHAVRTLAAIDRKVYEDQGASFRLALKEILPHMNDAYKGYSKNPFRSHLGISTIGKDCSRALWYNFRWFNHKLIQSRMLLLFNRGHLEEARFLAMLKCIGVQIYNQDETGKQFQISRFGGHYGGSGDGVAVGIPDIPGGKACLLEFKTHTDKSFKKLMIEGVACYKPEHYAQMICYMNDMGLEYGLYAAVNKNDDNLHMEIISANPMFAEKLSERAQAIIFSKIPPQKFYPSSGHFICKYCDHVDICHGEAEIARNCRSCYFSVPKIDGTWNCSNPEHLKILTTEDQLAGCEHYIKI
jgi:hypothetical protein